MKIIHFTASWCAPCKKIKPVVKSFIDNQKEIVYELVDVDENFELTKKYKVLSVPTLLFIDEKNNIKNRHVGLITIEQLQNYTT